MCVLLILTVYILVSCQRTDPISYKGVTIRLVSTKLHHRGLKIKKTKVRGLKMVRNPTPIVCGYATTIIFSQPHV